MSIRLDKWLCAARFYKTRTIAKKAIEGGKVHFQGKKTKTSKIVSIGEQYEINQSQIKKTIIVLELDDIRKSADQAQLLYEETPESILQREKETALRKIIKTTSDKPNKKQRRQIIGFKDNIND